MNKTVFKRLMTGLAVTAGMGLLIVIIMIIRFSYISKKTSPSDTQSVNDSVFCIRDKFVNAYLFRGYEGYLMVDAGLSEKRVLEELNKLGIDPSEILALILTHTDKDHTGALGAVENAGIFLHTEEEQMINGETAKHIFKTRWKNVFYSLFESGDILNIDIFSIEVIHTPGHTPGSCCFIVNGDYLLTGDNLLVEDGKYVHFFDMVNMDTGRQTESLKYLPPPGQFEYIFTGHSGIIRTDKL